MELLSNVQGIFIIGGGNVFFSFVSDEKIQYFEKNTSLQTSVLFGGFEIIIDVDIRIASI